MSNGESHDKVSSSESPRGSGNHSSQLDAAPCTGFKALTVSMRNFFRANCQNLIPRHDWRLNQDRGGGTTETNASASEPYK